MQNQLARLLFIVGFALMSCDFKGNHHVASGEAEVDSTILNADTTTILGEKYLAVFRTDGFLYIIKSNHDTIQKEPDLFKQFEFTDFNQDGNSDLLISYISNIAAKDLFLFDSERHYFKKVKDFAMYPEAIPVKGTHFYYSYHRMGCADSNWDSDLFYIYDFKTHRIAHLEGRQCEGEQQGIFASKVSDDSIKLMEMLPMELIDTYANRKAGLLEQYWAANHSKFK